MTASTAIALLLCPSCFIVGLCVQAGRDLIAADGLRRRHAAELAGLRRQVDALRSQPPQEAPEPIVWLLPPSSEWLRCGPADPIDRDPRFAPSAEASAAVLPFRASAQTPAADRS